MRSGAGAGGIAGVVVTATLSRRRLTEPSWPLLSSLSGGSGKRTELDLWEELELTRSRKTLDFASGWRADYEQQPDVGFVML